MRVWDRSQTLFHTFYGWSKQFINTPLGVFCCAAIIAAVFFIAFYGIKVLDPTNTDWLLTGGDLKQHYLGWAFYRDSGWSFPIGIADNLAYPYGLPITYMDSIPLLAIPFKVIAGVLPEPFQYFGWWGLLCYMLQGGLAALIIRKWTKNPLVILLIALVFIISPIMMFRMFAHTALASHWLILLGILFIVYRAQFATLKQELIAWSVLLVLSVLIHPYFVPMSFVLLAIYNIFTYRSFWITALKTATPLLATVVAFWVIGGLEVTGGGSGGGLREYSLNVNALINPLYWSTFLPPMPLAKPSHETVAYLGLGVLLLIPVAWFCLSSTIKKLSWQQFVKTIKKPQTIQWLLVIVVLILTFLAAAGPVFYWGKMQLVAVPIPELVEKAWSIFRANARLFWPVYYAIIFGVFAVFLLYAKKKRMTQTTIVIFLLPFIALQVLDIGLSHNAHIKHGAISKSRQVPYQSDFSIEDWDRYANGKKTVVLLDQKLNNRKFFALTDVALKYKLALNKGYFARAPIEAIAAYQKEQIALLNDGKANMEQNVYLTEEKDFAESFTAYSVTYLDGYYIIHR